MFKFYTVPSADIIDKLIGDHASIKLSSAVNLNDPFEFKFNVKVDSLDERHEKKFHNENNPNSAFEFKDWQEQAIECSGDFWHYEQNTRCKLVTATALCSFTEDNSNNLMWSHYTDNHKGICIEYKPELFEHLKTLDDCISFKKVTYSEEPPTINRLENYNETVEKLMCNKQSEWKYEKEHRIIFFSNKNTEFIHIDRKFIKSVYIGSRTDRELVKKILSVCNNTEIEIYYGITLGKTYQVQFKKHKEGTAFPRAFW